MEIITIILYKAMQRNLNNRVALVESLQCSSGKNSQQTYHFESMHYLS